MDVNVLMSYHAKCVYAWPKVKRSERNLSSTKHKCCEIKQEFEKTKNKTKKMYERFCTGIVNECLVWFVMCVWNECSEQIRPRYERQHGFDEMNFNVKVWMGAERTIYGGGGVSVKKSWLWIGSPARTRRN